MKFITIEPGVLMGITVFRDTSPHLILDDEHSQLFKLFSQILDIETYQTVIQIDICLVVKYVQGTMHIDIQSGSNSLCFGMVIGNEIII